MNKAPLNILHISTFDNGGAGRVAYNLHKIFKANNHNSKMLVLYKKMNDDDLVEYSRGLFEKIYQRVINPFLLKIQTDPNYCFFNQLESFKYVSTKRILKQIGFRPDYIIIYWVSKFINTKNIYELSRATKAPVFWYAVDMAPLTGGCHYAWDCKGYENNCGHCPALLSHKNEDMSRRNFSYKLSNINKTNLTLISGSGALKRQADESKLFQLKNKFQILIGIDSEIFKPNDKDPIKRTLNIPSDRKVLLIGSAMVNETRKGFQYLLDALNILNEKLAIPEKENIFLLIIGNLNPDFEPYLKFPVKYLGFIDDDTKLAQVYQAADIFVCPSIEDSGPMMINESIMCGTPVVSFDVGIAQDLVQTGETGYRAQLKSSSDLAEGIKYILSLNSEEYKKMSKNCRSLALKTISEKIQSSQIESLFIKKE